MFDPYFQQHLNEFGFILNSMRDGSYAGIFFLSAIMSYIIPLPEAVALVFFGFAAKMSHLDFLAVFVFSLAGAILGDNVVYRLSFFGNRYVEKFNKKMRESKLIQYEHLVVDNIGKAIYFLRFVVGIRFAGPVISGTLGIKWKDFFFFNATVNVLHTFIFVAIGYFCHKNILMTATIVEITRNFLTFSSMFIIGILVSLFNRRERKKLPFREPAA